MEYLFFPVKLRCEPNHLLLDESAVSIWENDQCKARILKPISSAHIETNGTIGNILNKAQTFQVSGIFQQAADPPFHLRSSLQAPKTHQVIF